MLAIRAAREVVGETRRAYLILNLVYYGLVVGAMGYAGFNRSLQEAWLGLVRDGDRKFNHQSILSEL